MLSKIALQCRVFAAYMLSYWSTALAMAVLYKRDIPAKCVRNVLRNQLGYTVYPAVVVFGVYNPPDYDPVGWWFRLVWQLTACVLLVDILFYPLHRLFHTKYLYKYFHKTHHEFKDPVGAAALYSGRLEYCLVNILPPLLAPVLVGCDRYALTIWVSVATANTVIAHAQDGGQHKVHHDAFGKNYGVGLMLMDRLFGTLASSP